jgi:hypothetical protein
MGKMSNVSTLRSSDGRFRPGQSGNPAGRPKGARNRATLLAEALRDGEAEAIRDKLVDGALAGDRVLLKFCAERLFARPGPAPIELDLAPGEESDPLAVLAAATRAMADGEIAPAEAVAVARVVNTMAQLLLARAEARLREAGKEEAEETHEPEVAAPVAPVFHLYPSGAGVLAAKKRAVLPALRLYPRQSRRAMLLCTASIGALEIGCGGQLAEALPVSAQYSETGARDFPDALPLAA